MESNRSWTRTTSLAIIIPWRDGGDLERRTNFNYVFNYYINMDIAPVVVSHDGAASGSFNRSAAYNRGMAQVNADTYLWNEADAILPIEQIEKAVTLAQAAPGNVIPFTERHELSPVQTQSVLCHGVDPFSLQGGEQIFLDGGSIGQQGVTSKETIGLIGGRWDEGFAGWGYDDNAMHHVFATLAGPPRWVPGKGMHLYHQPCYVSPSVEQSRATQLNAERFNRLIAMSAEELRNLMA